MVDVEQRYRHRLLYRIRSRCNAQSCREPRGRRLRGHESQRMKDGGREAEDFHVLDAELLATERGARSIHRQSHQGKEAHPAPRSPQLKGTRSEHEPYTRRINALCALLAPLLTYVYFLCFPSRHSGKERPSDLSIDITWIVGSLHGIRGSAEDAKPRRR